MPLTETKHTTAEGESLMRQSRVGLAVPAPAHVGQRLLETPPVAIARIHYGLAALCGLVGVVYGAQTYGGTVALFAVIAALGFGSFGFIAEALVLLYPLMRPWLPRRLQAMLRG